jgi:hypothetical protein
VYAVSPVFCTVTSFETVLPTRISPRSTDRSSSSSTVMSTPWVWPSPVKGIVNDAGLPVVVTVRLLLMVLPLTGVKVTWTSMLLPAATVRGGAPPTTLKV